MDWTFLNWCAGEWQRTVSAGIDLPTFLLVSQPLVRPSANGVSNLSAGAALSQSRSRAGHVWVRRTLRPGHEFAKN